MTVTKSIYVDTNTLARSLACIPCILLKLTILACFFVLLFCCLLSWCSYHLPTSFVLTAELGFQGFGDTCESTCFNIFGFFDWMVGAKVNNGPTKTSMPDNITMGSGLPNGASLSEWLKHILISFLCLFILTSFFCLLS